MRLSRVFVAYMLIFSRTRASMVDLRQRLEHLEVLAGLNLSTPLLGSDQEHPGHTRGAFESRGGEAELSCMSSSGFSEQLALQLA